MKKLSKFLAILLTVCLAFGMGVLCVSAISSTDDLSAHYESQLKPSGATKYLAVTDGSQEIKPGSTITSICESVQAELNGNAYRSLHHLKKAGTANSGFFGFGLGGSSGKVTAYGLAFNASLQWSAAVVDFDICADRYTYTTKSGSTQTYVTYTAEELANAGLTPESEGVDLSYGSGEHIQVIGRYWVTSPATNATAESAPGSASASIYILQDTDDKWYFCQDASLTPSSAKVAAYDESGLFNHVTAILYPTITTEGYVTVDAVIYVNGQYLYETTVLAASKKATSYCVENLRINVPSALVSYDAYSYGIDNYAVNYYPTAIPTNSGIGALIASDDWSSVSSTDISGIVASKDYISPNGYFQVQNPTGNRDIVSLPTAIADEMTHIEDEATIITTMDIDALDFPMGVEYVFVECDTENVSVGLSDALVNRGFEIADEGNGYSVAISDNIATLNWYDFDGNLISTDTCAFGLAPDTSNKNPSCVSGTTVKYADGEVVWNWSLEGDVGVINASNATPGAVVELRPDESCMASVTGATFVMGSYNEDYTRFIPSAAHDGTYTFYRNATGDNLVDEAVASAGKVCMLLTDFTGLEGDAEAVSISSSKSIPENTSVYIDLAGHVLSKYGLSETMQVPFFKLSAGGALSVFSSKKGGHIIMANVRTATANQTVSGGIVTVAKNVDEATLNVGALLDSDGNVIFDGDNLSYTGGSIIIISGDTSAENLSGGEKIKVNLIGGSYYVPFRGSSGFITLQGPDTVINIDGIELYTLDTNSTTSLLHEYLDYSTQGSKLTVKNSEIYASYLFNRTAYVEAHFENTTVAVSNSVIRTNNGGTIVIGAGNRFSKHTTNYIFDLNNVTLAEGVAIIKPDANNTAYSKITKDFVHSPAALAWADTFDIVLTDNVGDKVDGVVDTTEEAAYIASAALKASVLCETVTTYLSYDLDSVTVSASNLPDGVAVIEWQDTEGAVITTTYSFVGDIPELPKECAPTTVNNGWYETSLSWDGSAATAGKSVRAPSAVNTAKISGILQNATLFSDVKYNLYLPVTAGVENVSVSGATLEGTCEIEGAEYYIVSATPDIDDFDAVNATVSYVADGITFEYGVTLDILRYAEAVCKKYPCASEEAILICETLSFKSTVAAYANTAFEEPSSLTEFLDAHADCGCLATEVKISSEELGTDYSAIKAKGVNAITYTLDLGEVGMFIYVDGTTEVTSVSYTDALGTVHTFTAENGGLVKMSNYYIVSDISAAYIDNIMTITADGESGTYCLGKYINNNPNVTVAQALYTYAVAAENYKNVTEAELNDTSIYKKMQSVLLIGQSNMVGIGDLYTVDPISDDRLFMMRDDKWVKMQEPLHTNSSNAGIGLGASFGKAFVETFDCELGLIPAARGATTLEDWAVGGELYNEAVRLAKLAQETSEICAILWHQGEGNQNTADYAARAKVIFDNLIADLGLDPDKIVIVTGELFGTRSDAVHGPQLELLGTYYKNYGIAQSDGLTVLDVTTHFDAPSLRVFGYRYFDIFYNFITGKNYEFDDNPESYRVAQEKIDPYVYFPFDDMVTGSAYSGQAGSGTINISLQEGEVTVVEDGETNKYLSISNGVDSTTATGYTSTWSQANALDSIEHNGVLVFEMKIRLGEKHNCAATVLQVGGTDSDENSHNYQNFYIDATGNLNVRIPSYDEAQNKVVYSSTLVKETLSTTEWTSLRVIYDLNQNIRDVYVDDKLVLHSGVISVEPDFDISDFTVKTNRMVQFSPTAKTTTGTIHVDEYRCYPYADSLTPAE